MRMSPSVHSLIHKTWPECPNRIFKQLWEVKSQILMVPSSDPLERRPSRRTTNDLTAPLWPTSSPTKLRDRAPEVLNGKLYASECGQKFSENYFSKYIHKISSPGCLSVHIPILLSLVPPNRYNWPSLFRYCAILNTAPASLSKVATLVPIKYLQLK